MFLLQLICSVWHIVTAMDNNRIQAFNDQNYGHGLTNGHFLTQIDPTNHAHNYNVQDLQTNYELANEHQGIIMNKNPGSYNQLLTQGLSTYANSGLPLLSNSMSLISSDNSYSINDASALPFSHGLYRHNGQNLSNYHPVESSHINNLDNVIVPMDIQSKYDLLPFPNDYHYGNDISPKFTYVNAFTNVPMINPGEFGKDSHYCSSTFTSELDPIINQQIGYVPKPDNWVQNDAQHQLPDASQYTPIKSQNFTQVLPKNVMPIPNEDNADEDILNKMDAMDLSHTRLLTDGVLSANGHEHVLHPKDFTDHKNAQGRKTIELEELANAIWHIGLYRKNDDNEIECIMCNKPIKCGGGRHPSKAIQHLQSVHKDSYYAYKYEGLLKQIKEQMEHMANKIILKTEVHKNLTMKRDPILVISKKSTQL